MPSLRERLRVLEEALSNGRISAYRDLPFAIFRYDPEEEFSLRSEVISLTTRLRRERGKQVTEISLATLMFDGI